MSCNSASALTPICSPSFALGFASDLNPRVSPGSTSFSRNLSPSVTRNGLANMRAFLSSSCVFMTPHYFFQKVSKHKDVFRGGLGSATGKNTSTISGGQLVGMFLDADTLEMVHW